MVLDSFLKYSSDGEPQGFEAGRRSFDASASYDFDALGRARQAERERLERGEFSGALRDMVESGEAGVRMRAGDWYLESTVGGVCMWLRACGDNPSEDQKTFLSAERINRLLADAAVPDTVSDAGSATPKAGTTEKSAKSPEAVEAERKAGVLADLLVANPFIEKFYRFGDYVAPDANTFRSVVRDGNLAYAERPHRSELVGEIRAVWPDYVDPHARLHETKREKLPSGEMVGDTVSHLDSLIARYERMPGNHGRTTELLMGLRLGLSQDADVPAIGLQDGESLRRAVDIVDYLQDPEGYTGKVPDLWSAPGDMVNLLRYGTSFGMQETVAIVRDHTSGLLHKLWPEDAPYERLVRSAIAWEGKMPEGFLENAAFEWLRFPTASVAGGIDGALEVMQSAVDLLAVPDKIAGNIVSLSQALYANAPAVMSAIEQSIQWVADQAYVAAYIASVLFVSVELWPPGIASGLASIRNVLVRLGVPPETIRQILNGLEPAVNKAKNLVDQAKALNPIPEDKLPNAATVRKLGKTAFTRTDDTNTIRNTASKGAEAAEEQARRQAAETLSKLGSDALIATTFASTVRDRLESGISDADNAKLALDVYLREFSGDPGLATDTLADLKKGTSTTLQYRVTLLEERVAKVREVFEKEVVPVWRDIATIKAENNADIFTLLDYQKRIEKKLAGFSKLGQEVIGTMF